MHLAGGQGSSLWLCTTENPFLSTGFCHYTDKESKLEATYRLALSQLFQENSDSKAKNSVTRHKVSYPFREQVRQFLFSNTLLWNL